MNKLEGSQRVHPKSPGWWKCVVWERWEEVARTAPNGRVRRRSGLQSGPGRLLRAGGGTPLGSRSPCQLAGAALAPPRPAGAGRADPPWSPEPSAPRRLELGASPALPRTRPPARSPARRPARGSARPSSPLPPSPAPAARRLSRKVCWFLSAAAGSVAASHVCQTLGAHSRDERPSAAAATQPAAARCGRRGRRRRRAGPRLRARALPGARGGPGGGHLLPSADRPEPRARAAAAGLVWRLQPGACPRDGLLHRGPEGKVPRARQLCSRPWPRGAAWRWPGLHALTPGTALRAAQCSRD